MVVMEKENKEKLKDEVKDECGVEKKLKEWIWEMMKRKERLKVIKKEMKIVEEYVRKN